MKTNKYFLLAILSLHIFLLTIFKAQASCGTPENLQVQVSGNLITFSWSGTDGADIHAILLRNLQTGKDYKGYSSVGSTFATMTVPPGTYNWRVISACNTALRLTEDVSEWIWGTPFSVAKTNNYIPQAHAGCEQLDISGTSTSLSAMTPLDGTGQWSVLSGAGGSFGNVSSATSTFTGVAGETYILRWTVSNENGSSFSDVLVRFCTPPSQADAGSDQLNIPSTSAVLTASAPTIGTGVWSIVSGEGGGFSEPFSPTSRFITNENKVFVLRWTVYNVCGTTSDDVTLSFCNNPAIAGEDQLNILGTSTTLSANTPTEGIGVWSIISGVGGSLSNASSPTSTFTGTAGTTYVLRWTVSNDCGSSSDEVTVSFENPYLNPNLTYGSVTDIDGNQYATIQIGTQTWMAENLKVTKYNDGTTIPNVTDNAAWSALTTGAWVNYDNNTQYDAIYGKLYNWYAVNTGKLCPQGWHIPTDAEWTTLTDYLGALVAGDKTKSTTGWDNDGNSDNSSGFSGLPGGDRRDGGTFFNVGHYGYWWSATETSATSAWIRFLVNNIGYVGKANYYKGQGLSCRCLRD